MDIFIILDRLRNTRTYHTEIGVLIFPKDTRSRVRDERWSFASRAHVCPWDGNRSQRNKTKFFICFSHGEGLRKLEKKVDVLEISIAPTISLDLIEKLLGFFSAPRLLTTTGHIVGRFRAKCQTCARVERSAFTCARDYETPDKRKRNRSQLTNFTF